MKHNKKTIITLITFFFIIQIIGILVINQYYKPESNLQQEDLFIKNQTLSNVFSIFTTILIIFLITALIFKYKVDIVMKTWFLIVVIMSCMITINALFVNSEYTLFSSIISLVIASFLGFSKMFFPNKWVSYLSDILIYPGLSMVFIYTLFRQNDPKYNMIILFVLLTLISIYDFWAVNKSKIMLKMANYQMQKLNFFGGIIIPIISKEDKQKIKLIKSKYKDKKEIEKKIKRSKIKISAAALGGGDIAFTTIAMGMFMYSFPSQSLFGIVGLIPGLFALLGGSLGLLYIFLFGDPKKAYPAMPYITAGIITTSIIWSLIFLV